MELRIHRLYPDARMPRYMTDGAAGMDLHALVWNPVSIHPGQRALIGTGLAMAIPPGYEGQIRPRSGWAVRSGVTVLNAPGTIDSDYRGEIKVPLINLGSETVVIEPEDTERPAMRIAQFVIAPVVRATLLDVEILPPTGRGASGFGSTGSC